MERTAVVFGGAILISTCPVRFCWRLDRHDDTNRLRGSCVLRALAFLMGSKFLAISSRVKAVGVDVDVVSAGAVCVAESCDGCDVELCRNDHSRGLDFGTRALGRAPAKDLHGSRAAMALGCCPSDTRCYGKKIPYKPQLRYA